MRERELMMLSWLTRRDDILRYHGQRIRGIPLGYPNAKLISEVLWEAVDTHEEAMSLAELEYHTKQTGIRKGWPAAQQAQLQLDLEYMATVEVTGVTGREVLDNILLLDARRLGSALLKGSPQDIRKSMDEYRTILDEMQALDSRAEQNDLGIFPYAKKDLRRHLEKLQETYTKECLSFGISELDSRMLGGSRPQEVILIQASTNVGKTSMLLNLANHFAFVEKKPGVFFGLDNDEVDLLERSYAIRTAEEITGKIESLDAFEQRILRSIPPGTEENLLFRIWDPDDRSMAEITAHLKKIKADRWARDKAAGVLPESEWGRIYWVIIDYLDVIKPVQTKAEYRHQLKELVNSCKRLGREFNCPVFLATQGNRAGMTAEAPGLEHMAEAIGKAHPANHVLILHQSELQAELEIPEISIAVAKSRRPEKNYIVRCWFNPRTQRIWQNNEAPVERLRRSRNTPQQGRGRNRNQDAVPRQQGPAVSPQQARVSLAMFNPAPLPVEAPLRDQVVASGNGRLFNPQPQPQTGGFTG